jgi:hypothetical protein
VPAPDSRSAPARSSPAHWPRCPLRSYNHPILNGGETSPRLPRHMYVFSLPFGGFGRAAEDVAVLFRIYPLEDPDGSVS